VDLEQLRQADLSWQTLIRSFLSRKRSLVCLIYAALPGQRGDVPGAAIVTTAPDELMATIHARLPAILRPEDEAAWLDPQLMNALQVHVATPPK
jgi:putative SOS response-associated peptidase YedK